MVANATRGLGAGADPSQGEAAASESREELRQVLKVPTLSLLLSVPEVVLAQVQAT